MAVATAMLCRSLVARTADGLDEAAIVEVDAPLCSFNALLFPPCNITSCKSTEEHIVYAISFP